MGRDEASGAGGPPGGGVLRARGRPSIGALALLAALVALSVGAGVATLVGHLTARPGQVLVLLTVARPIPSGNAAVSGRLESVRLRSAGSGGTWVQIPAAAPVTLPGGWAAPSTDDVQLAAVPPGMYRSAELKLRLAGGTVVTAAETVELKVSSGHLTPLLFSLRLGSAGRPGVTVQAAYAGNDQVNFGLQVASGKVLALPDANLVNQDGQAVSLGQYRGKVIVLASFLTECQETCPLVTAALLQLRQLLQRDRIQNRVQILEVTQDPAADTPAILGQYQRYFGVPWPLLTGSALAIDRFWSELRVPPIQEQPWTSPAPVDRFTGAPEPYNILHSSVVDLISAQGYVASSVQAQPTLGASTIPTTIYSYLDAQGRQQQRAGGSWTPESLLSAVTALLQQEGVYTKLPSTAPGSATVGSPAPGFSLPTTAGGSVQLARELGHPLLIDFWATWCTNCRADMRLVAATAAKYRSLGLRVLLVDYQESAATVAAFLRREGVALPSLLDSQGSVAARYGVPGLPVAVFVSAEGRIAAIQVGQLQGSEVTQDLGKILGP